MFAEVDTFQVMTPALTAKSQPLVSPITMPPRTIKRVEFVIPPGCNGALGFALSVSGQNVIPFNQGAWIVGSGETVGWDIETAINSGAWQLQSWNIGNYPHTLYVRFLVDLIVAPAEPDTPQIVSAAALSTLTPVGLAAMLAPASSADYGV